MAYGDQSRKGILRRKRLNHADVSEFFLAETLFAPMVTDTNRRRRRVQDGDGSMDTPSPSVEPEIVPTASPATAMSSVPTNLPCAGLDRRAALLALLSPITMETTLLDTTTPQGMAFFWLEMTDTSNDPCSYPTVQQRYALATFYYATVGPSWTNNVGWLSALEECQWPQVTCEGNNVQKLDLGE